MPQQRGGLADPSSLISHPSSFYQLTHDYLVPSLRECFGGAVEALKVSSRKVVPIPSTPPTSFSVAGVQGLPFSMSENKANRTDMTLPS
jgi:hypothetical protein